METFLFALSFSSEGQLFFQIKNVDERIYILDVSVYWFFTALSLFLNLQDPEISPHYSLQGQLAGQDYKNIISNISDR